MLSSPWDAEGFEWDDHDFDRGNVAHLAAHGISPEHAEEVYYNGAVLVPNKRVPGRWLLIGQTNSGRWLTLVMTYDERRRLLRVFTGWGTTPSERSRYL